MSRGQITVLLGLTMLVCLTFAGLAAVVVFSQEPLQDPSLAGAAVAQEGRNLPGADDLDLSVATLTTTPTVRPSPTTTPTWTPSPEPTPTSTRVVNSTPTGTKTPTRTRTTTPLPPTATPVSGGGSGSGGGGGTASPPVSPTATYDPRFPFRVREGPVGYDTENHIFVVYLAITDVSANLLPGYRAIGDHQPTGFHWESTESCNHFCVASGPIGFEEDGYNVRQGNAVFEAPAYAEGVWTLYLVDRLGVPVSDRFVINIKDESGDVERQWFYIWLAR